IPSSLSSMCNYVWVMIDHTHGATCSVVSDVSTKQLLRFGEAVTLRVDYDIEDIGKTVFFVPP
ncbi:unnamed protein product, partial [marine sediment metagenome]